MERDAEEISFYLRSEKFPYTPWECKGHLFEHCGWDFKDERCSKIRLVRRCVYCGKIEYGRIEYPAIGKNSFDLYDEALIRSGILGEHYIERKAKEDLRRIGW
jgi:hypothetical protein